MSDKRQKNQLVLASALSYALPNAYFDSLGLPRLFAGDAQPSEPPDADPHVLVVWQG